MTSTKCSFCVNDSKVSADLFGDLKYRNILNLPNLKKKKSQPFPTIKMQKNNIVEIKVLSGDAAIYRSKAGRVFAMVQRRADRASVPQQIARASEQ